MSKLISISTALTGLLLVSAAGASPYRPAHLRRGVPNTPGYAYGGCYTEATSSRALTGKSYFDDLMTVEKCMSACTDFKYFGLEYGRECYCGNSFNEGSVETQLSDCSFTCPGDANQNCGAGNRLDIYTRKVDPVLSTEYKAKGCHAEPSSGRSLTAESTSSDDMTTAKCASFCGGKGYKLFGLEYYHECYCGNTLASGTIETTEADCKFPCQGDQTEKCGGDWRFNLYEFATSTTPTLPSPTPSAPAYTSEGCYTDKTSDRTLNGHLYATDAMTIETCATVCAEYNYFGLEYGRECWCGNTIRTVGQPAASSECNSPCAGNNAQTCGAGDRINIYRFKSEGATSTTSIVSSTSVLPTTLTTSSPTSYISSTISESSSVTTTSETTTFVVPSVTSTQLSTTSVALSSTTSDIISSTSTTTVEPSITSSTTTTSASELPSPTTTTLQVSSSSSTTSDLPTTTSVSTTTTTSAVPVETSAIPNGDFAVPGVWNPKIVHPLLTYNFADTNGPRSAPASGSITYANTAPATQAWFNEPITLLPNTRYNFSGYVRVNRVNAGCNIYFYIGDASGSTVLKIIASVLNGALSLTWPTKPSEGVYDTTDATQYTFNVRTTCSTITNGGQRTYYVDDLKLVAAN